MALKTKRRLGQKKPSRRREQYNIRKCIVLTYVSSSIWRLRSGNGISLCASRNMVALCIIIRSESSRAANIVIYNKQPKGKHNNHHPSL